MRNGLSGFNKESFLQTGALFGSDSVIWLFWGKITKTKTRPLVPSLLVTHFFLDHEFNWWTFENSLSVSRDELSKTFETKFIDFSWEETSRKLFDQQFQIAKTWISNKELTKVVPYVFTQSFQQINSEQVESFIGSALKKPSGFLYGAWENNEGIIGLTPELLVSQDHLKMKTMALAGTCSIEDFTRNPESFLQNKKEIKEHEIVVEDLVESLNTFSNFKKSERQIEKTPKLVHLKTEISWEISETQCLEDIIWKLHPTPALGCSPRRAVFSYMGKLNDISERGRFGAPFGFSESKNKAQVVVAIRNLSWNKKGLQMGTGCGVVSESEFDNEWAEVLNKKKSIKEIFNLL